MEWDNYIVLTGWYFRCHLFGLSGGMCKSTITNHCRAALLHAGMSSLCAYCIKLLTCTPTCTHTHLSTVWMQKHCGRGEESKWCAWTREGKQKIWIRART